MRKQPVLPARMLLYVQLELLNRSPLSAKDGFDYNKSVANEIRKLITN